MVLTDGLVSAAYSRRYGNLLPWMTVLNGIMSKCRVCIEWAFKKLRMLFAGGDFKPSKKQLFCLDFLFTNLHICFYGHGQSNEYFNIDPPTPEDYMDH